MWYRPRGSLGGFLLLMFSISYRAVLQSNQGRILSSSGERSEAWSRPSRAWVLPEGPFVPRSFLGVHTVSRRFPGWML